jgi:integral membrane protein
MDPRRLVRLTSFVEAVSYVLLLGVAMPLKYFWGEPRLVRVLGMAHGVLFLLLIWFLVRARIERGWPTSRVLLVAGAALVPIWPFLLDRRLRRWQAEAVQHERVL